MSLRAQSWVATILVVGGALSWIVGLAKGNLWWAGGSGAVVLLGFAFLGLSIRRASREIRAANARIERKFTDILRAMQPPAAETEEKRDPEPPKAP